MELKEILFVDDDRDIQFVAKMVLEKMDAFDIHFCSSGQEALEYLKHQQAQLIIMDVCMPVMDGPTAFKHFRELPGCEHLPVVFLTAKAQGHEIQELKDLGAFDVISKPFDPMALGQRIQQIWSRFLQSR